MTHGELAGRRCVTRASCVSQVARYVWNRTEFDAVDPETTDYLMGEFRHSTGGGGCSARCVTELNGQYDMLNLQLACVTTRLFVKVYCLSSVE